VGAYRNALLLQPDNTEWRLGLVRAVLRQQKYADAAALLDVLLEKYPDKSEFWLLQANAYLNLKQSLKAAENLECVDRLGKAKADDLFTLGDIYLSETLPDLAARSYARAVAADAQQKGDRALRSAELLAARGALAQSKQVLEKIRETLGTKLEENDRRKMLKLEARVALAQGGAGEAVGVLEEVVKLDPLDGEALLLLAQHYSKASQPEKAVFYYERAGNIEKFEAEAKVRHAQLLVTQSKYTDAVPLLRRAQELRPRDDLARYLDQIERLAKQRR
jgi:tetratricopeptide (TPR) repeat protein